MIAEEANGGIGAGGKLGQLYDMFDACLAGEGYEIGLQGFGLFGRVGEEEDFFDAG